MSGWPDIRQAELMLGLMQAGRQEGRLLGRLDVSVDVRKISSLL
jgi:hypothetical protein